MNAFHDMGHRNDRGAFGATRAGEMVKAYTLCDGFGGEATVLTYGVTLQRWLVPDRAGIAADVVLGYANLDQYEQNADYLGATLGRVAGRIPNGRFVLDDRHYTVDRNDRRTNALNGGAFGFDKAVWQVVGSGKRHLTLRHLSGNGDGGYPGALEVTARFAIDAAHGLSIEYRARCDAPTIINLANNTLFNMAGEGTSTPAVASVLTLSASRFLPVDLMLIETSEVRDVVGTAFDFRTARTVDAKLRHAGDDQLRAARGYDHLFLLDGSDVAAPWPAARLEDPVSGRAINLLTDQPALRFSSGNTLQGSTFGKSGSLYRQGDGVVLSPMRAVDANGRSPFGGIRLDAGADYRSLTVLRPDPR